jgi:hypothetical protein
MNKISDKFKKIAVVYEHFARSGTPFDFSKQNSLGPYSRETAESYLKSAKEDCRLDFSEQAMFEAYSHETFGTSISNEQNNGFVVGKKILDITISMWKQDLEPFIISGSSEPHQRPNLTKKELYDDPNLPKWFLDTVL